MEDPKSINFKYFQIAPKLKAAKGDEEDEPKAKWVLAIDIFDDKGNPEKVIDVKLGVDHGM